MTRKATLGILGILATTTALFAHARPAAAQEAGDATLASQRRALAIVERGIEASGGWEAVSRTARFRMKMTANQTRWGQEVRPGGDPGPARPQSYTITVDSDRGSFVADILGNGQAATPVRRIVRASGEWFMVRFPQKLESHVDSTLWEDRLAMATFAPGVLRAARLRAGTLRYLDRGTGASGSEDLVTFVDGDGHQTTLAFAAQTGYLVRLERLETDPLWGDLPLLVAFDDFRPAGDLVVPHKITGDLEGVFHVEATCLEVEPGIATDPSLLSPPEGARPDPLLATYATKRSVEPFAGIHQLLNVVWGYNALYVEQSDGVVVIEAPGGPATSEEILADVATQAPGKPVQAFVLTHHHSDHAAGLRTYVEKGIPVITTPGNRAFVEAVASETRTFDGVHPSKPAVIDVVEGRKTIGAGPNRFELINVGPNPHADEILIAYFPEHRMMYVPDIYGFMPGMTPPPLLLSFAERLDSLGLDVQTILTAHTDPDTMEGLKAMVQRFKGGR